MQSAKNSLTLEVSTTTPKRKVSTLDRTSINSSISVGMFPIARQDLGLCHLSSLAVKSKFDAPTLENVIHSETFGTLIEKVAHSTTRRTLFHNDLHEAHILIDPSTTKLARIIDLEGVAISPEWMAVWCFDGPDAYSPENKFGNYYDPDKIGLYIE